MSRREAMEKSQVYLLSLDMDLLSLSSRREELILMSRSLSRSLSLSRLRAATESPRSLSLPGERSLLSSFLLILSLTGDGESVGSLLRLDGLDRLGDLSLDLIQGMKVIKFF